MKNPYTAYKNRLFGKLQEQPELRMMNQALASRSMPYNQLNNQLQSMLQQTNASAGARAAAMMRGQMQIQDERQGIYTQALDAQAQRTDQLSGQLLEVTEKEHQWQEAYDQEQAAKKTQALRVGMQVLGTGIGALAGNPLMGYQIGSLASGALGIDKKGKLTAKPEQWDTAQILNSAVSIGGEIQKGIDSKNFQKNTQEMMEMYKDEKFTKMLEGMSSTQQAQFIGLMQWEMSQNKGKSPYALEMYDGYKGRNADEDKNNAAETALNSVVLPPDLVATKQRKALESGHASLRAGGAEAFAEIKEGASPNTHAFPTLELFTTALGSDKQKNAYLNMYNKLIDNYDGNVDDPKFIEWVNATYSTKGTYNKFKKIYGAAGGSK